MYDEEAEGYTASVEVLSGAIADLTKTASKPGGISLFKDAAKTEYKSTYEILRDISEIYDELTDKQQAELLEKLAGKRAGNTVAAILNNFKSVESSLKTMSNINSDNDAMAEMDKITQSMEYKLNALKETSTGVFQNLFKSDDMGIAIDGLTGIMEAVDFLTDSLGLFGTVAAGVSIARIAKDFSALAKTAAGVETLGAALKGLTSSGGLMGVLGSAATGNVVGLAVAGISAIALAVNGVKKANEEARKKAIETSDALRGDFSKSITDLSENIKSLRGHEDDFEKLSKGVDDYGNNISLTADEYEKYKDIVKSVTDMSPSLIAGFDAEGNAIANKNGLIEKAIEGMQELQRQQYELYVTDDKLWENANGSVTKIKEANSNIGKTIIPADIAFSGVKIEDGTKKSGFINQIDDYVGRAIGVAFDPSQNKSISEYIADNIDAVYNNLDEILNNARQGFTDDDGTVWAGLEESQINSLKSYVLGIKEQTDAIKAESLEFNKVLQIIPQAMDSYSELEDSSKGFLTNWINAFTSEDYSNKNKLNNTKTAIQEMTDNLANNKEMQDAISLADELNNSRESFDLSASKYIQNVSEFFGKLRTLAPEYQDAIKKAFEIENGSQFINTALDMTKEAKRVLKDEYDGLAEELSMGDLKILPKLNLETGSVDFTQLKAKLEEYKTDVSRLTYNDIKEFSNKLLSNAEKANSILSSQKTGQTMSIDDYDAEELKDYRSALEYVNGVLQLNSEKVQEITAAKNKEYIATIKEAKALKQLEYDKNAGRISDLKNELSDLSSYQKDRIEQVQADIEGLEEDNRAIAELCAGYDILSNSLAEVSGAYQGWLVAQSTTDADSMLNDVMEAVNYVNNALRGENGFGKGTDNFKSGLKLGIDDLIDPSDLDGIAEKLKNLGEYFNKDGKGNLTGLKNMGKDFLDAGVKNGLINFDKETGNYDIVEGTRIEDFADALGMTEPMVEAIFSMLNFNGGDFTWGESAEKQMQDLSVAADNAKNRLEESFNIPLSIDKEDGVEAIDETIDKLQELKNNDTNPITDTETLNDINTVIEQCVRNKQELEKPAIMEVDASSLSEEGEEAVSLIQEFQEAYNDLELKKELGVETDDAQSKVDGLLSQLQELEGNEYLTSLNIDTSSIDTALASIKNIKKEELKVKLKLDDSQIKSYTPEDKDGEAVYSVDSSEVDAYQPPDKHATVYYSVVMSGGGGGGLANGTAHVNGTANVNGTAYASGTALASGNWGTKKTETALTGELGREIVVEPDTGTWHTVGDNGAEFVPIKKGSIVFNHRQTESLLKNGYVTGRGRALVNGTAYAGGVISGGINIGSLKPTYTGSSSSGKVYKESGSDEETVDWIEILIDRIESAIDRIARIAESAFKSLTTKATALKDQISKVNEEIQIQNDAYKEYMAKADSIKLSDDLKERVRNGKIRISDYDKDTKELIDDYQEWYEKALECLDKSEELHEDLAKIYQSDFNNIKTDYDNQLSLLEHLSNNYESQMDMLKAKGMFESTEHYASMNDVQRKNIEILNKELEDLTKSFDRAMASGEIEEKSDAWYEMQIEINGVKEKIDDVTISILENDKAIRELQWDYFDYARDKVEKLSDEADFLINLMESSKLYDEKGGITGTGMATMGLHAQNYNVYMAQADSYAKEILRLDEAISKDPYNTEIIERREELLGLQQKSILAAEKEKKAMQTLAKQGIKAELDSIKELIKNKKDYLEETKDIYDFNKKISEHASDIATLQKQLSAYENDTSEENRVRIQKLKEDLETSQENLQESERDYYIKEQKKLLDELYDEYEKVLNDRLDEIDVLVSDMIDTVNSNSESINETLKYEAGKVGYTMTDAMKDVWSSGGVANAIVSEYGNDFGSKLTTTNNVLNKIASDVEKLIAKSNSEAGLTTIASTSAEPSTSNQTNTSTPSTTTSKNTPAYEDAKRGIAAAIWIYGGDKTGWGDGTERMNRLKAKFGEQNAEDIMRYLNEEADNGELYKYWASMGKGDLSKYYYSAFKKGGFADYTGFAWMDGTKTNPEVVLNSQDSKNFVSLRDVLREMSKTSLLMNGSSYKGYGLSHVNGLTDISGFVEKICARSMNMGNTVGDISITIPIDHVEDYEDFVNKMRADPKFEQFIQSITTDRLVGGSSLSKNKYKW